MPRIYSLAYLTSNTLTPPQAFGLRRNSATASSACACCNASGAPQQVLIGQAAVLRETVTALKDTGVGVFGSGNHPHRRGL
jgi:hypothetical protein